MSALSIFDVLLDTYQMVRLELLHADDTKRTVEGGIDPGATEPGKVRLYFYEGTEIASRETFPVERVIGVSLLSSNDGRTLLTATCTDPELGPEDRHGADSQCPIHQPRTTPAPTPAPTYDAGKQLADIIRGVYSEDEPTQARFKAVEYDNGWFFTDFPDIVLANGDIDYYEDNGGGDISQQVADLSVEHGPIGAQAQMTVDLFTGHVEADIYGGLF